MAEHTSKQFDAELENVRSSVLQMGGLVEEQITRAVEALISGEMSLIDRVIGDDHRVNALEVGLDEACSQIIARRQPAAGDLRFVLAVVGLTTDLERVGDEAKKIALQARKIFFDGKPAQSRTVEVGSMAVIVQDMLRAAIVALERQEPRAAVALAKRDAESDLVFQGVLRQLISFMIEDPRTITNCLDYLFVAKSLERIGDHAVNVSEHVVYATTGRDVRHASSEEKSVIP
jgi:phosphate transport system protein